MLFFVPWLCNPSLQLVWVASAFGTAGHDSYSWYCLHERNDVLLLKSEELDFSLWNSYVNNCSLVDWILILYDMILSLYSKALLIKVWWWFQTTFHVNTDFELNSREGDMHYVFLDLVLNQQCQLNHESIICIHFGISNIKCYFLMVDVYWIFITHKFKTPLAHVSLQNRPMWDSVHTPCSCVQACKHHIPVCQNTNCNL